MARLASKVELRNTSTTGRVFRLLTLFLVNVYRSNPYLSSFLVQFSALVFQLLFLFCLLAAMSISFYSPCVRFAVVGCRQYLSLSLSSTPCTLILSAVFVGFLLCFFSPFLTCVFVFASVCMCVCVSCLLILKDF